MPRIIVLGFPDYKPATLGVCLYSADDLHAAGAAISARPDLVRFELIHNPAVEHRPPVESGNLVAMQDLLERKRLAESAAADAKAALEAVQTEKSALAAEKTSITAELSAARAELAAKATPIEPVPEIENPKIKIENP